MNLLTLRKYSLLFLTAAVPLFFISYVFIFSVNLPYRDDYTAMLLFLNQIQETQGFWPKVQLLIQDQFGHRIFWIRFVTLIQATITGVLNIKAVILVGTAGLFIAFAAVVMLLKKDEHRLFSVLIGSLLLFHPMYSENLFQAMASVSAFYVFTFGFISVYLLVRLRENRPLISLLAFVFAFLACFSHQEGLVFLVCGILISVYFKRWIDLVFWLFVTVLTILVFYRNDVGTGGSFNLINSLLFFLTFVGSNFGINQNSELFMKFPSVIKVLVQALPVLMGLVISGGYLHLCFKRYDRINPGLMVMMTVLFLVAAGASLMRSEGATVVSRYRIVSALLMSVMALSYLELLGQKSWSKVFSGLLLGFAMIFNLSAYVLKYRPVKNHRIELETSYTRWLQTGSGLIPIAWTPPDAEPLLMKSLELKTYRLPDTNSFWINRKNNQ